MKASVKYHEQQPDKEVVIPPRNIALVADEEGNFVLVLPIREDNADVPKSFAALMNIAKRLQFDEEAMTDEASEFMLELALRDNNGPVAQ